MKLISSVAAFFLMSLCSAANLNAQNILPNGSFSNVDGVSGWQLSISNGTLTFSSNDAENSPNSGSMLLSGVSAEVAATSACFGITPNSAFHYSGKFAVDWNSGGVGDYAYGTLMCTSFPNTDCSGSGTALPPATNADQLTTSFRSIGDAYGVFDANARSANCQVSSSTFFAVSGTPPASTYFDDLVFELVPAVKLGGYMSGNWFDPNGGGEGFQLEFTDQANAVLAMWFTYAPDGSGTPIWIYSQGVYDNNSNSVTTTAGYFHGATFPPQFSPAQVAATPWGTLTFTFSDCNHGTASWSPTIPAYAAGSMPITRLTAIAGTTCPQ